MAEEARLESVCTPKGYREFESRSLRKALIDSQLLRSWLFSYAADGGAISNDCGKLLSGLAEIRKMQTLEVHLITEKCLRDSSRHYRLKRTFSITSILRVFGSARPIIVSQSRSSAGSILFITAFW